MNPDSPPVRVLACGEHRFTLDRPLVMGVLNLTPDSFSDGGRFLDPKRAHARARQMRDEGADLIDIGAESTRPGAPTVPDETEWQRLAPVLAALVAERVPVSVDTRKPAVMRWAVAAGAAMINDVAGFRDPEAIDAVAGSAAGLCVMHMGGDDPATMQAAPQYGDVVTEVRDFLDARVGALQDAGVEAARLVVDPGFGFGKTLAHNLELMRRLPEIDVCGLPVLIGVSRKSMVGALTGRAIGDRLAGSLAAMLAGVARGAAIVRVHDVAATCDALRVWEAIRRGAVQAPAGD